MELTRYLITPAPEVRGVSVPPRTMVIAAVSIAAGCAFVMFCTLLLIERSSVATNAAHIVVAKPAVTLKLDTPPAAAKPEVVAPAATSETVPETPVSSQFALARSWHFQKLGQSSVKLLRTDPKRNDFDLAFRVQGHVVSKHHLKLNQPIVLSASNQGANTVVLISKITRSRIYGVVLDGESPSASGQIAVNRPPSKSE